MMQRGQVSFWHAELGPAPRRAPLQGDDRADVAIIGAGYTGLWAAYYLAQARPEWRIVVGNVPIDVELRGVRGGVALPEP
jgi:NADPH-dependent 2,4-dienoyl-CoA reductase/sulfur reductase-like enzyme